MNTNENINVFVGHNYQDNEPIYLGLKKSKEYWQEPNLNVHTISLIVSKILKELITNGSAVYVGKEVVAQNDKLIRKIDILQKKVSFGDEFTFSFDEFIEKWETTNGLKKENDNA